MEYFYYELILEDGEKLYAKVNSRLNIEKICEIIGFGGEAREITLDEYEDLADFDD